MHARKYLQYIIWYVCAEDFLASYYISCDWSNEGMYRLSGFVGFDNA